jgi:hypothetical protein
MAVRPNVPRIIRLAAGGIALSVLGAGISQAAEAPAQRKTTQSESYVVIDPIYATILEGNKPRGLLMIEFGLDIPDGPLRTRVNNALPALRDAYVRSLIAYGATAVRPWRQPSVEDVAERMQVVTDGILGQEGAKVLMAQTAIRLTQ